ncbi:MAG: MarR family transcriptional regulator [Deltaproteobacteria bacterium]|nr:MarR family transcriptional regulator [Deltaproteobacteria bacterium]
MSATFPPELWEDPYFLTTRAATALHALCRKALRDAGVTDLNPAQLAVLAMLDEDEGRSATLLARRLHCEKSSLTPMLGKLEANGHLLRARDPKDGRLQRLFLTKKGRRRRREAEVLVQKATEAALGDLSRKVLRHHVEFCQALLTALGEVATSA